MKYEEFAQQRKWGGMEKAHRWTKKFRKLEFRLSRRLTKHKTGRES